VDLQKKTITNSNCSGANCDKGPSLLVKKDGSMSVSGVTDFKEHGKAAFKLDLALTKVQEKGEGLGVSTTVNVKSSVVTENGAPVQLVMGGTIDDKPSSLGSLLLNVVPQVVPPDEFHPFTPLGKQGNMSDTDVNLYEYGGGGSTIIEGAKDAKANEYQKASDYNKKKEAVSTYKKREK